MLNKPNHLAVRTEDHPLEYLTFHGEIPQGQYGAGSMTIWDSGTYEAEKMRDNEVIVTLHGERVDGKYALFQTKGNQWMIHRMSPPADPSREPVPHDLKPMLATASDDLPLDQANWAFEMKWDGMRVIIVVEAGQITLTSRLGQRRHVALSGAARARRCARARPTWCSTARSSPSTTTGVPASSSSSLACRQARRRSRAGSRPSAPRSA